MTVRAREVLSAAEVIVGYTTYVNLVRDDFPQAAFLATGMRGEVERCEDALRRSREGRTVGLISSGDPGVYGMAGIMLELAGPDDNVEIVPGVTAALSGAAGLGAPLGHDFCVISLSDRLTEWDVIARRLEGAAAGDFAICLYNPASRHRKDYLRRACEILLRTKGPETVCGMARCIGRDGESMRILTLSELAQTEADMFTTVFIGSSQTRRIEDRMVTPRGYRP